MEQARNIVVLGSGRSGTTWIAEVLAAAGMELVFEPFSWQIKQMQGVGANRYLRAADSLPLEESMLRALRGELFTDFTIRANAGAPRKVIKLIRANMMVEWIAARMDALYLFVIRNPLAVVASQFMGGWTPEDIQGQVQASWLLKQEHLVEDHLAPHADFLRGLTGRLELLTANWCVQNLVPLRQGQFARLPFVHYDDLVADPVEGFRALAAPLEFEITPAVEAQISKVSFMATTAESRTAGYDPTSTWRRKLSKEQQATIVQIVERFGLADYLRT